MKGVVIAGTHSGCGKTTVTLGLLAALKKKGLEVQPFKAGPDFIDTGLHRLITGRPSRNLDLWMSGEQAVIDGFRRHTGDAGIAVIEGVMGMYDGEFSTATLALTLGVPVILVVDSYGLAESAGAIVRGFADSGQVAGVVFNRVASVAHYERLKSSVRDIPVLGYLPRELDFEIPHRHLGLVVAEETPIAADGIERLAAAVLRHIDIDAFIRISGFSETRHTREGGYPLFEKNGFPLTTRGNDREPLSQLANRPYPCNLSSTLKIAVAYDKAFCFYYEDNLDLLRQAGAELIFFSPLSDTGIPANVDAVYIGGGYPELNAEMLARNSSMLDSVRVWAGSGRPLYAECGGLMYLSQGIRDFDGKFYKMTGVFPFETRMMKGRSHLGYREIALEEDCILGRKGQVIRGHEFHYSEIIPPLNPPLAKGGPVGGRTSQELLRFYKVRDRSGEKLPDEGYGIKRALASYVHLHFAGNREIADNFIKHVKEK